MTFIPTKTLTYFATVITLAAFLTIQFNLSTVWFPITAILFALARPLITPQKSMAAILLSGLSLSIIVYIISLLYDNPYIITVLLFIATLTSMNYGIKHKQYFLLALTINALMLLAVSLEDVHYQDTETLLSIVLASLLAAICQLIFLPKFKQWQNHIEEVEIIHALRHVAKDIFSCLTQKEYPENVYFFEHRLHLSKLKYFRSIEMQQGKNSKRNHYWQKLFDILMDMAAIRRRVTDHTVFSLCDNELKLLSESMNQLFVDMESHLAYRARLDYATFSQAINAFTNHYQTMLNVAAKEPLAFLLFIASLNDFADEVKGYA